MALTRLGLVKTTLIDFPDEVAATVFTPGCNLRCPYCHNPELIAAPFADDLLGIEDVRNFLTKRANVLGGVCITGGEPLMYGGPGDGLVEFIEFVRELGLKVKLDTNGCYPDRIDPSKIDYIAMDIKTQPEKYGLVSGTGVPRISAAVRESIGKIIGSGLRHEFRTTMCPGIAGPEDAVQIAQLLSPLYSNAEESYRKGKYVLTQFRPGKTLDPNFAALQPFSIAETQLAAEQIRKLGISCEVRGL